MKLGIGAAQFGMDYGISNLQGKTAPDEVRIILEAARDLGIDLIDTATGYGDSEAVLGSVMPAVGQFRIVTKTPAFAARPVTTADAVNLKNALLYSQERLKRNSVYGLLMHSADDLLAPGGELLYEALRDVKQRALVGKIGASVYTGVQIEALLDRYDLDIIQLPLNVLDRRLIASGALRKLRTRGTEIHVRSIFLQGLLLMDPELAPSYFDPVRPLLKRYHAFLRANRLSPIEGAFSFIKHVPEIDYVIIGVNNASHLRDNINAFTRIYDEQLFAGFAEFSLEDPRFLNPAQWPGPDSTAQRAGTGLGGR